MAIYDKGYKGTPEKRAAVASRSSSDTTSTGKVIRRVGSDEAPSSFQPRPDNAPSGPSGLTTDQRRAGMTVRDLETAPTQPIDTSQPSPQKVAKQATVGLPGSPITHEFSATTGQPLAPGESTTDALGNTFTQGQKFKQAFQKSAGLGQAPATQGAAAPAMPPPDQAQAPSPIAGIMETDKNFDSILTNFDDWFSPPKQKQTLLQEYKSMEKALGIQAMNEEMIDAKRIIEGTEDDIRAEVTAAGGFATDSQVLSMANARNKSLIKNYNYLLESRDSAMTQLNTMMNLSMEDRKMAENEFDRKLNFAFKVQEFQERAKTNASNQLNKIVENIGYGGLLAATNGNAYEQGIIEKTLGLGAGGLATMASYVKPLTEEEKLDLEIKRSTLKTDELQRANIRSQISERDGGGLVSTEVVESNGKKLLINSKTGETIKEIGAGETGGDMPLMIERGADRAKQLEGLISNDKGLNANAGMWRRTSLSNLQNARDWQADAINVLSRLTVDELGRVKADGVTFGALSDPERKAVGDAASALNAGMIMKDDGVTPTGQFRISEKKVKEEFGTILKYQKLDMEKRTGVKYDDYKTGNYISPAEKAELDNYFNNSSNNALTPGQFNPGDYY